MRTILDIQKQLLPDLMDEMKKRYTILQHVMVSGSIGRRTLASSLDMTERVLRAEVDFLKAQGLIEVESSGMHITEAGRLLLEELEPLVQDLFGLTDLEEKLRNHFGLKQLVIVPGDSDSSSYTKKELGRAAASVLRKYIGRDEIIAVTGGSTMAEIANRLTAPSMQPKGHLFVPARGGIGESVEMQANTIASIMAKKTGGQYRLLHVPDHLSEDAFQTLSQEPNIQEIISVIRSARIVIHGIGEANIMSRRRRMNAETMDRLQQEGALAEAFGYYFDSNGRMVHKMPTVGLRIEDIEAMDTIIGVAGGKSKGAAIAAVLKFGHEDILVTDEAAATEVLKFL